MEVLQQWRCPRLYAECNQPFSPCALSAKNVNTAPVLCVAHLEALDSDLDCASPFLFCYVHRQNIIPTNCRWWHPCVFITLTSVVLWTNQGWGSICEAKHIICDNLSPASTNGSWVIFFLNYEGGESVILSSYALPLVCNGCNNELSLCLLCPWTRALCNDMKNEIASIQDRVYPEANVLAVHRKVMSSMKGPR